MRLVTWNCRGGFHRKIEALSTLQPDVAIVQECAAPFKWAQHLPDWRILWHGADSPIGVAVLARPGIHLALAGPLTEQIRCFLPAYVQGDFAFGVLGAWTKQGHPGQRSYVGQLALALDHYGELLANQPCIVAGDLNSNAIWDKGKPWQHNAVAARLDALGLSSVYHAWYDEKYGEELLPTYRHNTGQPFHLDYCFLPTTWLPRVTALVIGSDDWLRLSDHRPLVINIDL